MVAAPSPSPVFLDFFLDFVAVCSPVWVEPLVEVVPAEVSPPALFLDFDVFFEVVAVWSAAV